MSENLCEANRSVTEQCLDGFECAGSGYWLSGGLIVYITAGCRTYDPEVVDSTPSQITIKRLLLR